MHPFGVSGIWNCNGGGNNVKQKIARHLIAVSNDSHKAIVYRPHVARTAIDVA
jgi:hypothetical protein